MPKSKRDKKGEKGRACELCIRVDKKVMILQNGFGLKSSFIKLISTLPLAHIAGFMLVRQFLWDKSI